MAGLTHVEGFAFGGFTRAATLPRVCASSDQFHMAWARACAWLTAAEEVMPIACPKK